MAEENKIATIFTATTQGLTDGLNVAGSQIKGFAGGIQGSFNGLGGAVGAMTGPLMALGGVLAGGAMFKEAISATTKWNGEAMKMARTLNITTEEASVLNVALGDIYTDSETYLGAMRKMTMQLNSGGAGFKKLGLDMKDSNGKLKESVPLMQETLDKLNKIEGGTQRNAAGTAIFGRSWGEAQKMLKLNATVMEEAKQKAEKLNLVVGGDAVEATKNWKAAQNDMDDALLGVKLTVGQELLPVFSDLMTMFSELLVPVIKVLSVLVKGLVIAWETLKFAIRAVANVIGAAFGSMLDSAGYIGSAISKLLKGDWEGAKTEAKNAAGAIKNNFVAAAEGINADYEKLGDKIAKIVDKPASTKTKVGKEGSEGFDPDKQTDKQTGMKKWEAELAAMKAKVIDATNGFNQLGQESELEFWQGKLAAAKGKGEEYAKVMEKINGLKVSLAAVAIAEDKEASDRADALYLNKKEDRFNAEMADLERRKMMFSQKVALGMVNDEQELAQQRKFLEESTQLTIKQLQVEQDLYAYDAVKREQIQTKINELQRKSSNDIAKLNADASTKTAKSWMDAATRMSTTFGTVMGGMLAKTMTFQQGMAMILKAALAELLKYVLKVITAKATEAGAGAAASAAQTPVVGWAMAIPAMGAVMAAVLGLGSSMGSAAGGWDIPAGVNPIGQLHAEEMVLPKEQANVIRDMAKNGGAGQQAVQNHFTIHAMDSRSFEDALRNNRVSLARVSQELMKDGVRG